MTSTAAETKARRRFPELRWEQDYVIWRGPLMANGKEALEAAEAVKSRFAPCVTADNAPALAVELADGSTEVFELAIPPSDWHRGMSPFRRRDLSPIQFAECGARSMRPKMASDPVWVGRVEILGHPVWQYRCNDEETASRLSATMLHQRSRVVVERLKNTASSEPWLPMVEVENRVSQVRDAAGNVVSCATEAGAWHHAAQALATAVTRAVIEEQAEPIVPADVAIALPPPQAEPLHETIQREGRQGRKPVYDTAAGRAVLT